MGGTRKAFEVSSWFPFPLVENVVMSTQTPPIGLVMHKNSNTIGIGMVLQNNNITLLGDPPLSESYKEPHGITRLLTKDASLQKRTNVVRRAQKNWCKRRILKDRYWIVDCASIFDTLPSCTHHMHGQHRNVRQRVLNIHSWTMEQESESYRIHHFLSFRRADGKNPLALCRANGFVSFFDPLQK